MLPWTFFSSALADSSNSIADSASLISKVYFPRLTVPMAAVGVGFVDFAINLAMLIALLKPIRAVSVSPVLAFGGSETSRF
jgi:lipopolysaccharide transport system permease protein